MKTLVLYTTTYGHTEAMVEQLSEKIKGEVDCFNLMQSNQIDLNHYGNLVIGGSIYMGQVQKQLKQFCEANEVEILKHPIDIFLSCGIEENFESHLKSAFTSNLLSASRTRVSFGGVLNLNKMKFMHKTITKVMIKSSEKEGKTLPKPNYDNIERLANSINNDII